MTDQVQKILEIADDELIVGWRNSEWTGIAPMLEEDVAFSSISQNEIGHARALYELAARALGTTADALALDRRPEEYRCAPFVELRRLEWARTIARHWLYETADQIRLESLKASSDGEIAALAAKIDREEVYHRLHAEMWIDRLLSNPEGSAKLQEAVEELWPYALGVIPDPEIPVISLVDLGVVREVEVDDSRVRVAFTPTFLGCPALEAMKLQLEAAIAGLGAEPEVEVIADDSWSTDRITPEGREKLRASGFAPPAPRANGAPQLVQLQSNVFRCPYCGSRDTTLENIFGPTPCRSLRYCRNCRQPFEQFK